MVVLVCRSIGTQKELIRLGNPDRKLASSKSSHFRDNEAAKGAAMPTCEIAFTAPGDLPARFMVPKCKIVLAFTSPRIGTVLISSPPRRKLSNKLFMADDIQTTKNCTIIWL